MASIASSKVALVVPTLNGGSLWREWLAQFATQTYRPAFSLVVDSSSDDDTAEAAERAGFKVMRIRRDQFDHGGTRQAAFSQLPPSIEFVIFMTQDAVLASPEAFQQLICAFEESCVGAVYGRQLPRPSADAIEAHARLFNYPDCSYRRCIDDVPKFGIKTAFISNSFAAYRCEALRQVGGFPGNLILGEDAYVAARMISAGWYVAYRSEAVVHHSHDYTFAQYFRRYFDVGVFHARESWIRDLAGQATGEGAQFVKSELKFLLKHAPLELPRSMVNSVAKFLGYKLGLMEEYFPTKVKVRMSMTRTYWKHEKDDHQLGQAV